MKVSTILRLPRTVRSAGRLREILMVLIKHGFGELVDQLGLQAWLTAASRLLPRADRSERETQTLETRIRRTFEDLGPTFVKLGQVLATRPDLIPMSLVLELRKLQDRVPPFPFEQVQAVVAEELGRPIEAVFAEFDPQPIAAASIGQVHRARLETGEEVVVKVQRPELGRVIDRDLEILRALAGLIHEKIPEARQFNLPGIAQEFSGALRLEADYTNERANQERFIRLWADDDRVSAPRPYPELSTARVLTMEFIRGVKVTDLEGLASVGADVRDIARLGSHIALRGIFDHGFFHADPHPGNFFVLPGGRITLIDFGMMGVIDRERLDELLSFLVALLVNDPDMMVRLFLELDLIDESIDLRSLKREIKQLIDRYYNVPVGDIDLGRFINQVFEVVVKHDVRMPADLLLVGKALTTIEGIAQEIDPTFDPVTEMRPYLLKTYVLRVLDPAHHAKELSKDVVDLTTLVRKLPGEIRTLLKKVRKGELRVVTATEDLTVILERHDRRVNRTLVTVFSTTAMLTGTAFALAGLEGAAIAAYGLGTLWFLWAWLGILRTGGV